jgi:hypothetical protein
MRDMPGVKKVADMKALYSASMTAPVLKERQLSAMITDSMVVPERIMRPD